MEYFYCPKHKKNIPRYQKHSHDDCFMMFYAQYPPIPNKKRLTIRARDCDRMNK